MTQTNTHRFKGTLSEEYELFISSVPKYTKIQERVGKEIAKYANKQGGSIIKALELGISPGITTKSVLKFNSAIHITAVDNEPDMIKKAKERLTNAISDRTVTLIEMDIADYLPTVADNSIDVFFSGETFHNFSNTYKPELLTEIHRILKPGGLFINADKIVPDSDNALIKSLQWAFRVYLRGLLPKEKCEYIKELISHDIEDAMPDKILREQEMISLLKDTKFTHIKFTFKTPFMKIIKAIK